MQHMSAKIKDFQEKYAAKYRVKVMALMSGRKQPQRLAFQLGRSNPGIRSM